MSKAKNNNPADDLLESLLKDIKDNDGGDDVREKDAPELLGLAEFNLEDVEDQPHAYLVSSVDEEPDSTQIKYESTSVAYEGTKVSQKDELGSLDINFDSDEKPKGLDDEEAMNPSMSSLFDPVPKEVKKPIPYKPKKSIEELLAEKEKAQSAEVAASGLATDDSLKDFKLSDDPLFSSESSSISAPPVPEPAESEATLALTSDKAEDFAKQKAKLNTADDLNKFYAAKNEQSSVQQTGVGDRTIAVTGFQNIKVENHDDKVKVSIGQNRSAHSTGYASWGGGAEASLGQAENLKIAQEKILELERENEKLRVQNDELISASDIIKERSDLLTAQITEFRNDKEGLEESFKNEVALLKGHLHRKESEFQKAQIKVDDLESRLKFDMKKIRVRERELENRLELIRAEKNAVTKSKDEQILDLRRKMDVLQMEVDSYRQKCVDLNKLLENNQDSFKRTTRALRLAMANLELQEENKVSVNVALKKVD